jgi:hypothetical protein
MQPRQPAQAAHQLDRQGTRAGTGETIAPGQLFQRHLGRRRHDRRVLTGAIPSYFFKQQSDKAAAKATALAGITDPAAYQTLMNQHPELA